MIKLGSLFSGSGGFELAGQRNGIEPIWASEIEKFPIAVTTARFPNMKHLGDITQINGKEIEPVDIITGGSPCQDLSVAGKRAGLIDGERSNLFMEQIRITKEMRKASDGKYPSFMVWENVFGAFSSNKGEDFQTVLEEICKIADPNISIPEPPKGKWNKAGVIMGDTFSVAWRTLDAQFWGVPQRRRRIFLVADFGGQRAREILFECESVSGDIAESGEKRERIAKGAESSVGAAVGEVICVATQQSNSEIMIDKCPTITQAAGTSGNNKPYVCYGVNADNSTTAASVGFEEEKTATISATKRMAICYDARGNGNGKIVNTLTGDHQNRVTDYTALAVAINGEKAGTLDASYYKGTGARGGVEREVIAVCCEQQAYDKYVQSDNAATLKSFGGNYGGGSENLLCAIAPTLDVNYNAKFGCNQFVKQWGNFLAYYAVRRLTPKECQRLQGFADDWCEGLGIKNPTDEELEWWSDVFETHRRIVEPNKKPKTKKQIAKWLKNPHSDSAEYKMWGNGVALPCVEFVLGNIAEEIRNNFGG